MSKIKRPRPTDGRRLEYHDSVKHESSNGLADMLELVGQQIGGLTRVISRQQNELSNARKTLGVLNMRREELNAILASRK